MLGALRTRQHVSGTGELLLVQSCPVLLLCLPSSPFPNYSTFCALEPAVMLWGALLGFGLLPSIAAFTTDQLRERSIYQVLTDRFARHDGYQAPCNTERREYCGGTWKGVEQQLDYIQGMGFDTGKHPRTPPPDATVWISPVVANIPGIPGSSSYHGMLLLNVHA
jgi:hypothetical protein